jgi:hypothetical protein
MTALFNEDEELASFSF